MNTESINELVEELKGFKTVVKFQKPPKYLSRFKTKPEVKKLAKAIQEIFPSSSALLKWYRDIFDQFPNAPFESNFGNLLPDIIDYICDEYNRNLVYTAKKNSENGGVNELALQKEERLANFILKFCAGPPKHTLLEDKASSNERSSHMRILADTEVIGSIPNLVFIDNLPIMIYLKFGKSSEYRLNNFKKIGTFVKEAFGHPAMILVLDQEDYFIRGGQENGEYDDMRRQVSHYYKKHGIVTTCLARPRQFLYDKLQVDHARIKAEKRFSKTV